VSEKRRSEGGIGGGRRQRRTGRGGGEGGRWEGGRRGGGNGREGGIQRHDQGRRKQWKILSNEGYMATIHMYIYIHIYMYTYIPLFLSPPTPLPLASIPIRPVSRSFPPHRGLREEGKVVSTRAIELDGGGGHPHTKLPKPSSPGTSCPASSGGASRRQSSLSGQSFVFFIGGRAMQGGETEGG